jgi:ankyrin repeat protein
VVFAANNEQYLEGATVAIASILDHATPGDYYHFHIYTTESLASNGISTVASKTLKGLQDICEPSCSFSITPVDSIMEAQGVDVRQWGLAGVLRIALPRLLPLIDKIIYMDCDMVSVKDLRLVDNLLEDQDTFPIAGVVDINSEGAATNFCKNFNQCDWMDDEYINSGLLVMDLERLRKDNFSQKVFEWLSENKDKAMLPDQDAINMVYKGKIKVFNSVYAWPSCFDTKTDNVVIMHYLAEYKPWKSVNGLHVDLYKQYLQLDPFVAASRDFLIENTIKGNTVALRNYLKNPLVNTELQDQNGRTPLLVAVTTGNLQIVEIYLQRGANIEAQDKDGRTALMLAVINRSTPIVMLLLEYGANNQAQDHQGLTAISWTLGLDNSEINSLISDYQPNNLNPKDFAHACKSGLVQRVEFFLKNDMPVDFSTATQPCCLILASQKGYREIVKLLINHGANINLTDGGTWTAREWAANNKHTEVVHMITRHSLQQMHQNGADKDQMLLEAANYGLDAEVEILLNRQANPNARNENNMTALMLAAKNGHVRTVNALLQHSADACLNDGGTWTAREWAKNNNHLEIVEALEYSQQGLCQIAD